MPKAEVAPVERAREKEDVRNVAVTDMVAAACLQGLRFRRRLIGIGV